MDKAVHNALQFEIILKMIEPAGDSGKHYKRHLTIWKHGQESKLKKEYARIDALINIFKKQKGEAEQFKNTLANIPWLPQTIKALASRPLLLHELAEIKKLIFYAKHIRQLCKKNGLSSLYHFPELDKIYELLDPEHKNSPSFALSSAYAPRLANCLAKLQDLQLSKRQKESQLKKDAQKALHLSQPTDKIVVSRLQTSKITRLNKSSYFQLAEENFANLTYTLKDTKQLTSVKKQISILTIKLAVIEEGVLNLLSKKLKVYSKTILQTSELSGKLDWDCAKAVFAITNKCIIPKPVRAIGLNLAQAVNLPLKATLANAGRKYQTIDLDFASSINVITGPNMGGKTTALKTAGQFCLMMQYALPVPAKKAQMCIFDTIWYNQEEGLTENLSSFGKEIVSLAGILKKKGRNLLLMDELAKGTNPIEGEAILIAVLEYVKNLDCLTLAATHYDKPALLKSAKHFAIKGIDTKALSELLNPREFSLEEQLNLLNTLMDYSLTKLNSKTKPPQNAIPIAQALGLPEEIILLAKNRLN